MPLPKERIYTIDDIYALPEGERAELIDGQIYYMAPPSRKHQEIAGELFTSINNYIRAAGGSCKPYIAPNKLYEKGCVGAPDWIIEIVSPGSRRMDYNNKLFKYRTAGVREYWIVDPQKEWIMVYSFFNDDMNEYSFTDDIPSGIYPGFSLNLSTLNI